MSKNLTRKGLAFGALVALGSTLFAGVPAQANSSGPLTLLPNGGTAAGATYTSLIGAGLTLSSTLDAGKQAVAVPTTLLVMDAFGVSEVEFNTLVFNDDTSITKDNAAITAYNEFSRIKNAT